MEFVVVILCKNLRESIYIFTREWQQPDMGRVEKTAFISYRRTNAPWALAVFQDLTRNGYDVFFDFQGIASGDFERVILESIKARAHFLVLLTPSALERCGEPGERLRALVIHTRREQWADSTLYT